MIARYSIDEVAKIWSNQAKFERWLRLEAAHCALIQPELALRIKARLETILSKYPLSRRA